MTKAGPRWTNDVRLVPHLMDRPIRWKRSRLIFVNSMSDLFHHKVPDEYIAATYGVMAYANWHIFQTLTKRADRQRDFLERHTLGDCLIAMARYHLPPKKDRWLEVENRMASLAWPPPNVWVGVSAEDQETWDERVPLLMNTRAHVRWVSAEPLLGAIMMLPVLARAAGGHLSPLHWVVAGGESGPEARPMRSGWARSLRDQARAARIPFYFKQWGEWIPSNQIPQGSVLHDFESWKWGDEHEGFYRMGTRTAGHLLDGVEHYRYPGGESFPQGITKEQARA